MLSPARAVNVNSSDLITFGPVHFFFNWETFYLFLEAYEKVGTSSFQKDVLYSILTHLEESFQNNNCGYDCKGIHPQVTAFAVSVFMNIKLVKLHAVRTD